MRGGGCHYPKSTKMMVDLLLLLVLGCLLPSTTGKCIESLGDNVCYNNGAFTLSIPETNTITFASGIGSSTNNAKTSSIEATPTSLQLTQSFVFNGNRFTIIDDVVPSSSGFEWTTTWTSHSSNVTGFDDSSAALLVNVTSDPVDTLWTPYVAFPPLSIGGYLAPFPWHAADFVYGTELDPHTGSAPGSIYQTSYPSMLFTAEGGYGTTSP